MKLFADTSDVLECISSLFVIIPVLLNGNKSNIFFETEYRIGEKISALYFLKQYLKLFLIENIISLQILQVNLIFVLQKKDKPNRKEQIPT